MKKFIIRSLDREAIELEARGKAMTTTQMTLITKTLSLISTRNSRSKREETKARLRQPQPLR